MPIYEQMQKMSEVYLSDLGVNINEKDKVYQYNQIYLIHVAIQGKTLLHYVACLKPGLFNKTSPIDCLVDAGADLDVQDKDGRTPLMICIATGATALDKNIKLMINHCAGTPALNVEDNDGNNVLHLAAAVKESKYTKEYIKVTFYNRVIHSTCVN